MAHEVEMSRVLVAGKRFGGGSVVRGFGAQGSVFLTWCVTRGITPTPAHE